MFSYNKLSWGKINHEREALDINGSYKKLDLKILIKRDKSRLDGKYKIWNEMFFRFVCI